jgi:flagellar assembly protein FliH
MDSAHSRAQNPPRDSQNPNLLTAAQIEELQKQAYEEAYAVGLQEGREAGQEEIKARAEQLDQLMSALAAPFAEMDDEVEQDLVTLVIAMVRQLVRREIKTEPGQIIAVVREAMAILPTASRNVRLRLHPEDAILVREALSLSDEERSWKVVEDPVLTRGGCRVITDDSQIDASVETRVAQLIAKLFGGERQGDRPRRGGD